MEKKKTYIQVLIFIALSITAITILYPIFFMIMSSFKEKFEYYGAPFALPKKIQFENYKLMIHQFNAPRFFLNSMIISLSAVALNLIFSTTSGFIFAKYSFRGKKLIYTAILALMMIPGQVMIIPTYVMYSSFGLMNTYYSVILAYTVGSIPFSIFLITSGFRSIPNELIESARLDGSSFLGILVKIVIPVGRASVITVVILNFVANWNELIVAMLYLQKDELKTLTAAVATIMLRFASDYPFFMTGLLINCFPPVLIYLLFQKYIISGITVGAIK